MLQLLIRPWAKRYMRRHEPDRIIGIAGNEYMRRWNVIRFRGYSAKLHYIKRSDEDRALHDHPWPSLSLVLDGALVEHVPKYCTPTGPTKVCVLRPGDWSYRPATFAHRLEVPGADGYAITLFMTGPRERKWGFWCPQGWRHWRKFLASGCDDD